MAEMYAGHHRNVGRIERFLAAGEFVAARTPRGVMVFCAPLDHVLWTEPAARVADALGRRARELGLSEKHFWLTGTASALTREQLRQRGWILHEQSAKNPEKLKELQALFLKEAVKYSVLPLDDRTLERLNAALVGRPDLMAGRTSLTVYQGMIGISENAFINVKNRSHTITAEVEIPKKGANGVILAQGGRFGGWSLYVKDGKPTYTYNWLGLQRYAVAATQAVPPGKASIRFEFAYDGGGVGKGGTGTLFVNGKKVAATQIQRTQCCVFSLDDAADVGADEGTPVTEAYKVPFKFTGKIATVTVELKDVKTAEHDEAEQARKVAALKKALAD